MLNTLKENFFQKYVQSIVLDRELIVQQSDNCLFYIKPGTYLPDFHPFFHTLDTHFDQENKPEDNIFYCVQMEILGKNGYLDIQCALSEDKKSIHILLLNLTNHYKNVHVIKQGRNESVIGSSLLKDLNEQLEIQRGFKNKFIADVSHELRTPLNAILGFLDILQNTGLDRQQIDLVNIIQDSSKNLTGIVNDLLDISKIEAGKLDITSKRFAFRQFLEDLAKTYSLRAEEKRLEFKLELDEKIPKYLVSDELRLRQVLINLLENAFKFTEEGSITLRVTTPSRNARKIPVTIEVIDTGIGIETEDQSAIFDSFTQLEKNGLFGGVGLGLSIVSKIIDLLDSHIEVSSVKGKGSTFKFTLQLGVSHDQSSSGKKTRKVKERKLEKDRYRILLGEDIEVNQLLMMRIFAERKEYSLDLAKNGERVIQLLEQYPYDLVLMDLTMPVMDGFDTALRIRAHENKKINKIPIIAVSARASQDDIDESMEVGMNDYITKPIDKDTLFAAINRQLTKYKRGAND